MTAVIAQTPPLDPLNQIITLLEQLRNRLPFAEEELVRHTQLRAILAEQQERSAEALLHGVLHWQLAGSARCVPSGSMRTCGNR